MSANYKLIPIVIPDGVFFKVQQTTKHTANIKVSGREFLNIKKFI